VDEAASRNGRAPLLLTFDDGGESASTLIAGALERHGWRGHFFVTTDYIGKPGFLSEEQIKDLHARGHVIGSHSCSHPPRMSHCGWDRLMREWSESVWVLSEILEGPVKTASVPGGYYSREVAEAAGQAGIRFLFTSEPTVRPHRVGECLVLGRYFVQRGMPPSVAAGFAAARAGVRWKQALLWNVKKAAKAAGGEFYLRARSVLLARNGR
jgi:peptidoglycan/xylan/chitin deacetylase (PgdA/CDA1 family)